MAGAAVGNGGHGPQVAEEPERQADVLVPLGEVSGEPHLQVQGPEGNPDLTSEGGVGAGPRARARRLEVVTRADVEQAADRFPLDAEAGRKARMGTGAFRKRWSRNALATVTAFPAGPTPSSCRLKRTGEWRPSSKGGPSPSSGCSSISRREGSLNRDALGPTQAEIPTARTKGKTKELGVPPGKLESSSWARARTPGSREAPKRKGAPRGRTRVPNRSVLAS